MNSVALILSVTGLKPGYAICYPREYVLEMTNADMESLLWGGPHADDVASLLDKFHRLHGVCSQYDPIKRMYTFYKHNPVFNN